MFLQRIRVPDFRVLKNVDISFEKEFTSSIFPLGSLNGGGKSTLLQLVFVLLHCSTHPDRIDFLKNLLEGFRIYNDDDKRILAIIDIWDGYKNVELEFFTCKKFFIKSLSKQDEDNELTQNEEQKLIEEKSDRQNSNLDNRFSKFTSSYSPEQIKKLANEFKRLAEIQANNEFDKIFTEYLIKNKTIHICDIYSNNTLDGTEILLCHSDDLDINELEVWLNDLSKNVFLAAPISQIFLFLSSNSRKLLFKNQTENNYYLELKQEKTKLPGFFTYDFMSIDILIKSFTEARDKDFIQAIETGTYGNSYKALLNDLNSVLINKKINLNKDFSGVNFKRNDNDVELYPEDLSHGELKRLFIYMWIKYNKIENAIVLMDEIEIAFHPDWQYQIIRDLEEWSPTNQYILATHSYELCEAVTPAHVKVLPPKLINPNKPPSS